MTNEQFIQEHRSDDVRRLAFAPVPEGVSRQWCLQQIAGWQTARRKLPAWADTPGLWYGPHLALEQCSSQATAEYKAALAATLASDYTLLDLTGGLGVDFAFMARAARQATYVERQEELCRIARHNLPLLGLEQATVVCADTPPDGHYDIIFADPARRDNAGRKVALIEDCQPDIAHLAPLLLTRCRHMIVKLSPMLDIAAAIRALQGVQAVHIVSVRGECKELLLVLTPGHTAAPTLHCVNLDTTDDTLVVPAGDTDGHVAQRDVAFLTRAGHVAFSPHAGHVAPSPHPQPHPQPYLQPHSSPSQTPVS